MAPVTPHFRVSQHGMVNAQSSAAYFRFTCKERYFAACISELIDLMQKKRLKKTRVFTRTFLGKGLPECSVANAMERDSLRTQKVAIRNEYNYRSRFLRDITTDVIHRGFLRTVSRVLCAPKLQVRFTSKPVFSLGLKGNVQ